ncbi:MAG: TetR/AcrR family transcriptional regulator [Ruminococcus sp.]|nr:TetR/AcrR family transcriptional regulator [Ruminococcus sp.]MBQ8297455.1 TetR/AcrR family transcriptional regulator [Ruminococcus sp.]
MDMRTERTRKNIINAFLQLRSKKPLEKITVKELSALAEINKATFYLHYHDIYELAETLENEVVQATLHGIEHPELIFQDTRLFVRELTESFIANERLIKILFEGNRSICFITLLEKKLKQFLLQFKPEYNESLEKNIALTYMVYGGYYAYMKYNEYDTKAVFDLIGKFSDAIVSDYE